MMRIAWLTEIFINLHTCASSEVQPMVHVFNTKVRWTGGKRGELSCGNGHKADFASPPEFMGEPGVLTGPDAFVAAINMNFMETFLTFAERGKIELKAYESDANGIIGQRKGQDAIIRIVIHPKITVGRDQDADKVEAAVQNAKKYAVIMNSVVGTVVVEFKVEVKSSDI
jgi:organic hydroperoxide reductase OsmC/OhrA